MTENHPITPPSELVQQWIGDFFGCTVTGEVSDSERYLATQAARWGADQELEACCEWLQDPDLNVDTYKLRAARRPKPLSLAEEALDALNEIEDKMLGPTIEENLIRTALERLKELEQRND